MQPRKDRKHDRVSVPLREAEKEVDEAYRSNPLVRRTFGEAAWYFLAGCEEHNVRELVRASEGHETTEHEQAAIADNLINHAKWPMRWIRQDCVDGAVVPGRFDDDAYGAAWELSALAQSYLAFESAFTYASLGVLSLHLEGDRIVPAATFREDARFEAYDRIADLLENDPAELDLQPVLEQLVHAVRVDGERFTYPLNPRIVRDTLALAGPAVDQRFKSPAEWKLAQYSLAEFAQVGRALWAMSAIHFNARTFAAVRGCKGLGYLQALVTMPHGDLVRRVARYANVSIERVEAILADLTFGSGDIRSPDPALQPLVRLTPSITGWAPNMLLNNAMERNLLVLMNRLPDSRQAYNRLSQEKEAILRTRMQNELGGLGLRFWNGTIGWDVPLDLDLAVISDTERHVLCLELKSFIGPAEAREIFERSQEIERGIEQVHERTRLAGVAPEPLLRALGVDSSYTFSWAVASETSIGGRWVQNETVPVVRTAHLVAKILALRNLQASSKWLEKREYLPVPGRHYEVVDTDVTIGRWTLPWHGIKVLDPDLP